MRMIRPLPWRGPMCVALVLAAAGFAPADDQTTPPAADVVAPSAQTPESSGLNSAKEAPSNVRFEFNTYIWMTALSGTAGVKGTTANVDASFQDILDASNSLLAFSGRMEFGVGKLGFYVDGFWADLGADAQPAPRLGTSVDITFDETFLDFGGMYRLGQWDPTGSAEKNPRKITLDLYAGGRYTSLNIQLDPRRSPTIADSESWVDPLVGAKLVLPFAEHWHFSLNGDVGGFGVGSSFAWSAVAMVGYDFTMFNHPANVFLGYKAIGQDYINGEGRSQFTWDIITHGPILGFGMSF